VIGRVLPSGAETVVLVEGPTHGARVKGRPATSPHATADAGFVFFTAAAGSIVSTAAARYLSSTSASPSVFASAVAGMLLFSAIPSLAAEWNGNSFKDESTLEFRTVNAEGEGHWSTVWLVVLDGDVYVNLGDRAVDRLESNATKPLVSVRVADHEFEKIRVEPAQDRQPDVARAIADKYWTGFLVPYRAPSTVMRLRPDEPASQNERTKTPAEGIHARTK
jgi:hypothetical protein